MKKLIALALLLAVPALSAKTATSIVAAERNIHSIALIALPLCLDKIPETGILYP